MEHVNNDKITSSCSTLAQWDVSKPRVHLIQEKDHMKNTLLAIVKSDFTKSSELVLQQCDHIERLF